jgi:hypothetical protein
MWEDNIKTGFKDRGREGVENREDTWHEKDSHPVFSM